MKYLIFDAGPIINFAMNGSLDILRKLKQNFDGEFLITKEVKYEIIDHPQSIKKYELEALQIKELFDEGIIKHADLSKKQIDELREKREELILVANDTYKTNNKSIHIIDKGEAASLALSYILGKPNFLVVDERTTRMLCESPENLRKLLERKLHTKVTSVKDNYKVFSEFKIIRSTELAYIAYKKKLFNLHYSNALEAMLYGLKYRGCSISESEIEEMKKSKL